MKEVLERLLPVGLELCAAVVRGIDEGLLNKS